MIIFNTDPSLKIIGQISLVNLATGESPKIINSRYLPNQLYQIVLDKNIPSQEYLMTISFKNDYGSESNLVGFHKINYVENGITKYDKFSLLMLNFYNKLLKIFFLTLPR